MIRIVKISLAIFTCIGISTSQFPEFSWAKANGISLENNRQKLLATKEGDELRAKIIAIGQQSTCAGVVGQCEAFANFVKAGMVKQKIAGKHVLMENSVKTGAFGRIYHIPSQQIISADGTHQAVVVKIDSQDVVFDNLSPKGTMFSTWIGSFASNETDTGGKFKITYTAF